MGKHGAGELQSLRAKKGGRFVHGFLLPASALLRRGVDHRHRHRLLALRQVSAGDVVGNDVGPRVVALEQHSRRLNTGDLARPVAIAAVD
jgi:hypothetical protein